MADVLSQSQIDRLLSGLGSQDPSEILSASSASKDKVKVYDFNSPKKFTKERLRTIDSLYESFTRFLTSYFTNISRVFCEIEVIQVEEQRYFEYNNALPDNSVIGLYELTPTAKKVDSSILLVNLSTQLGFYLIDKLLGGSGKGVNINRDFTDIEIAILENVLSKFTRYFDDSWGKYIEVETQLQSVETNPRLVQVSAPEDVVLLVSMEIRIKDLTGTMTICIPALNLEQLMENFTSKYARFNKQRVDDQSQNRKTTIMNTLKQSDLEMTAILDQVEIDLNDILQLQVNDVIPLNKRVDSDITIAINNSPWFKAKLGETKLKKAIKISQLVEKEEGK